ncbi:hypothetical protein D8674_026639 [Pyrus ussuriensis x Pyrus communis]|uniref:Uncharacterized protein n=1 Tax=Pyrus ussuriensis x Pyrus communis TaxID=2448454 RepID=A0A5N5I7D6_9ROSA|nr:hypothetical protein D8674_026639 [Pyrus ussuriensis x Pyrus communis]
MVDCGARSSKTIDGECSGKELWYGSDTFGGSRYRITSDELIGVVKSDMGTRFSSNVGVLVCDKCGVDWETWRAIPEEMKIHLINELATCCIDNIFKSRFQEWKF